MGRYVNLTLGKDEKIILSGRFPLLFWIGAWAWLIFLGVFIVGIVFFIRDVVNMRTTEFAVTDRRVVLKRGLFTLRTQEIDVHSIEGVRLDQTFWGRVLGFGSLVVTGTGEARIVFPTMADPVAFRRAIETARPTR